MNKEFRLPDVGEGLTEADIVSWHVKPGDTVTINQVIVEIETAKAVVELPSPYAGTVSALLVTEGQTVDVGIPIITIDVPVAGEAPAADAAPAEAEAKAEPQPQPPAAAPAAPPATPAPPARQPVLVGYGVKPGSTSRRPRKSPPTRPGSYPATPSAPPNGAPVPPPSAFLAALAEPPPNPRARPRLLRADPQGGLGGRRPPNRGVPGGSSPGSDTEHWPSPGKSTAKPPVRRLARDLGIDLDRADGQRAGRVGHQGGCAEGGRRSNGPFDTSVFCGANRRPARPSPSPARPDPGPPRSGSRCAGCASTPPPRWWRARSPRPM